MSDREPLEVGERRTLPSGQEVVRYASPLATGDFSIEGQNGFVGLTHEDLEALNELTDWEGSGGGDQ